MTVTLINSFEVPKGREEEFLSGWKVVAEALMKEPGFLSTKLHRSLNPKAKFQFVNVAEWENQKKFDEATTKVLNCNFLSKKSDMVSRSNPSLYSVIYSDTK